MTTTKKCTDCKAHLLLSDPDVCELCDLHAHDDDRYLALETDENPNNVDEYGDAR